VRVMEEMNNVVIDCCGRQAFWYIIICQFERFTLQPEVRKDATTYIDQKRVMCGKCELHRKRRVLSIFTCATIIDLKFQERNNVKKNPKKNKKKNPRFHMQL